MPRMKMTPPTVPAKQEGSVTVPVAAPEPPIPTHPGDASVPAPVVAAPEPAPLPKPDKVFAKAPYMYTIRANRTELQFRVYDSATGETVLCDKDKVHSFDGVLVKWDLWLGGVSRLTGQAWGPK